jgi:serine/threonine-protein kinase RsbW
MGRQHTMNDASPRSRQDEGPHIQLELSLGSEVRAISPFVDTLMYLVRKCRWIPENEQDVEIALREALANAVIHGNHEDPTKQIYVGCRGGIGEISIVIRDEGQGFDIREVADPTAPENIQSPHGRGIFLMKALMDEVRFEQGGTVVYLRKSVRKPSLR